MFKLKLNPKELNQLGITLVLVMVLTLIMSIIVLAVLGIGLWAYEQATFYEDYNQALYSAEAGLNYAISKNVTSVWTGPYSAPTTGSIQNASFTVSTSTTVYTGDTVQIISVSTVERLSYRSRIISINLVIRDPWKHFIWQGCEDIPAGSDPTQYPSGYNSTSNGPVYGSGTIGSLEFYRPGWAYAGAKFQPYWSNITSKTVQNAVYIGRDTTIVNITPTIASLTIQTTMPGNTWPTSLRDATGLRVSFDNPSTYTIYGAYTGMLYIQGTINVDQNGPTAGLDIYGQCYAVGGNINITNNANLTVMQVTTQSPASLIVSPTDATGTTYQKYVTIGCIDTTASAFCDSTTDPGAGSIKQQTGNATLYMGSTGNYPSRPYNYPGGVMYVSNSDIKNGQGTDINGVIMMMSNNINGFPSGNFYFDSTVQSDAPILGVDVSLIQGQNVAASSWQELPTGWGL